MAQFSRYDKPCICTFFHHPGNDHAYIDPLHLLAAMLRQNDGPKALLERAGANVAAMSTAVE
ncbi:Clp protease N-terminal domain-containing protein, partial [Comamonas kerstersii]|uniref:Clp protease N-terminal domain-containing protein n=1 Tax=Comamonas kerstersii TaxID=225992 RepID=UPI003EE04ADD